SDPRQSQPRRRRRATPKRARLSRALDPLFFGQRLDVQLIAAVEHGHPRPAPVNGLKNLPALDGRLLAGVLGRRLDLDEFPHVSADISENSLPREAPEWGTNPSGDIRRTAVPAQRRPLRPT